LFVGPDGVIILEDGQIVSAPPSLALLLEGQGAYADWMVEPIAFYQMAFLSFLGTYGVTFVFDFGFSDLTFWSYDETFGFSHSGTGFYAGSSAFLSGVPSVTLADGTIERTFPNGATERVAPDGTVLITLPDGTVTVVAPDGTIMTTLPDGTVTVRTPDGTTTTTLPDGTIIETMPDGTIIRTLPDGTVIKALPDGTIIETLPDGTVIRTLPDGTEIKTLSDGTIIQTLPDGTVLTLAAEDRIPAQPPERQAGTDGALPGKEKSDIDIGSVAAGMAGWGMAASRQSNGRASLDRKAFEMLERDSRLRNFRRWKDGRFYEPNNTEEGKSDSPGFQFLPFVKRKH
jgi:hypothetical protein